MSHSPRPRDAGNRALKGGGSVCYQPGVASQSRTSVGLRGGGGSEVEQERFAAVSLFSGCGGFCEGIDLSGFDVRCGVETDRFAAETYRFNFPRVPLFEGDIRDFLTAKGEDHRAKYGLEGVDLVFGGPPCQGYSQIGTRDLNDDRNSLYREFARVVETLRPRLFLMENVPNLLLMRRGHYRDLILKKFRSIGYANATFITMSAADYGVPQLRQRVFFTGTPDGARFDFDLREFLEAALSEQKIEKPFTVRDAIGDLPADVVPSGDTLPYPKGGRLSAFQKAMRLDHDASPYTKAVKRKRGIGAAKAQLHNHHTKEIQERRKRLIALLKPGEKADSLPKRVWNGLRPEKWRRLHPDLPSYTILAQMHRDLSEWVHPELERWITVREAARLQSFHDGFIFMSSEWQQLKQIGNAVPPLLAYALGRAAFAVVARLKGAEVPKTERPARSMVQAVLPYGEAAGAQ